MGIKVGEVGKQVVYATGFDMSSKTTLEIHITPPTGAMIIVPNARISLNPAIIVDADLGDLPANTCMTFLTQAGDFPIVGVYQICGVYNDATPRIYYGDKATITVDAGC
jgi:hypothetical protein